MRSFVPIAGVADIRPEVERKHHAPIVAASVRFGERTDSHDLAQIDVGHL